MTTNFPNTGSLVGGHPTGDSSDPVANAINTTLSTQIIIKVSDAAVGALQSLSVAQNRPLQRIQEIGTDGVIEIIPNNATTFELTANRIVFDQLRLPEAFSRGFRFINSQRLPFDILVIDFSNTGPNEATSADGHIAMTYRNCWFTRYDTPYAADNYIITETATLWCETAFISSGSPEPLRQVPAETDNAGVESAVNAGTSGVRGALDASGLINSFFS